MQPSLHIQQEAADAFFTARMLVVFGIVIALLCGAGVFVVIGLSSGGYSYTAAQGEEVENAVVMQVAAEPGWHGRLFGWAPETFVVVGRKGKVLWVFDGNVQWVREDGRELPPGAQEKLNNAWSVLEARQAIIRKRTE